MYVARSMANLFVVGLLMFDKYYQLKYRQRSTCQRNRPPARLPWINITRIDQVVKHAFSRLRQILLSQTQGEKRVIQYNRG